jgi:hypothetical protein
MRCLLFLLFLAFFITAQIPMTDFSAQKSLALAAEPLTAEEQEAGETEEDEAKKYAGPEGFRKGNVSQHSLDIFLDGKKVVTFTGKDLEQLAERKIFSPRGPKVAWPVLGAIEKAGIKSAKTVRFVSGKGKNIDLAWTELVRAKEDVVLSYNFNGELILETDVADKVPDRIKEVKPEPGKDLEQEEKVRKQMHKDRKRSLIFLRNIARIDLLSN